jgi:glucan phosphoethanolaminetransferase (alkaline phosphatase superfamily)
MRHQFPLRILVFGLLVFILGWIGIGFSFCIENCSNRDKLIGLPAIILFYSGIVLIALALVIAIYRSILPKKIFWCAAIVLIVIIVSISLVIKHRNNVTHQKVTACFQNLKPGDNPLKCHYIK